MRIFYCDNCRNPVFFENVQCVKCGRSLAYIREFSEIGSLTPLDGGRWKPDASAAEGRLYRLCRNYAEFNVCNWAVADDEPHEFCFSCRLTEKIPDLGQPGHEDGGDSGHSSSRGAEN